MDISKILFTLSYVEYKQFNFSLLVNAKSIERKVISLNIKRIAGSLVSTRTFTEGDIFIYNLSFFAI